MGDSGSESAIPIPIPIPKIIDTADSDTIPKMIEPIPIRFRFILAKNLESEAFSWETIYCFSLTFNNQLNQAFRNLYRQCFDKHLKKTLLALFSIRYIQFNGPCEYL